ncbi:MAG: histidine kinase, partial [Bacteroidota bacterium]
QYFPDRPIVEYVEGANSKVDYTFNMYQFGEDELLLNAGNTVSSFEPNEQRQVLFEVDPSVRINSLYIDKGLVYVLSKAGLLLYNKKEQRFESKEFIFSAYHLNSMIIDQEGNAWLGTSGSGVIIIPSFKVIEYSKRSGDLPNDRITMFWKEPGQDFLWCGFENGQVWKITQEETGFECILAKDFQSDEEVISMMKYPGGGYFINVGRRLIQTDKDLNILAETNGNLKVMIKGLEEEIWFGSHIGVLKMPLGDKFSFFQSRSGWEYYLESRTYALLSEGTRIWMGSVSGLYFYDYVKDEVFPFLENGKHQDYRVSKIRKAKDGTIWVSTLGSGILHIKDNELVKKYSEKNGLSSNRCNDLLIDGPYLWVATDQGVDRFDLVRQKNDHFNILDGLPTNEVSHLEKLDKQLILGTPQGIVILPDTISGFNLIAPKVYIESFFVGAQERSETALKSLSYKENNLAFQFASLNYRAQGLTSFKYRLLGLNPQWVATNNRSVQFLSLSPGNYRLEVIAFNEDGIPSEESAFFEFSIIPPWWGTIWFRITAVLGMLLATYSYLQYRFRLVRKKELEEKEMENRIASLRMQALQTQMNPHFTFNALNAIQQFLATNQREAAMIHLADFANLIRTIFEQSKNQVISFEDELNFLDIYLGFEKLRFGDKVEIVFSVEPELRERWMAYQLPPLLLQPIIENAFRHGLMHKKSGGQLEIIFTPSGSFLSCIIRDNGVGRQRAASLNRKHRKGHISSGIKATKERLKLWHKTKGSTENGFVMKDLVDSEGQACGTEVHLII